MESSSFSKEYMEYSYKEGQFMGQMGSFCQIEKQKYLGNLCWWGWKNLLNIRDLIMNNVKCIVGNGNDITVWFDNWNDMGHLFKILSHRDLYDARLKEDLNLSDMITKGQWNWPEEWYDKFPMVTQIAYPALNDVNTDRIVWRNRDEKDLKFSVSIAYADMSIQYPIVPWWKLIWFSHCIPKHSFIVWLAVQDRLTTQDKLRKWGDHAVNRCCLCCQESKNINHILFQCSFSRDIWRKVSAIADIDHKGYDLTHIIQSLINAGNGNNTRSVIRRMAFSSCVYNIWPKRNGRIFKDAKRSGEEVLKCVVEVIKHKLLGITVKDSKVVKDAEAKWMVSYRRLVQKS
ncbi:reverse transcriptase zinc-binding domain-containing protein [Tanacetum coccineum]